MDPRLVVLFGVLFTSQSSIYVRLSEAPALAIAANRMVIVSLLLLPFFFHERLVERKKERYIPAKTLLLCVVSGLFLAVHFATWIYSLEFTTIASATVIVNTHPLFVVLLGFFLLRERITKRSLALLLVIIAGSVLLSVGDVSVGRTALKGDLYSLVGAATIACYMVVGRYVRRSLSARSYTFLVYSSSAAGLLLVAFVTGTRLFGYSYVEYLIFGALALFCTIFGHSLFNWALKYVKTATLATLVLAEPIFATILGFIIFNELPPALTFAGASIMLVGLILFVREEYNVKRAEPGAGTNQ